MIFDNEITDLIINKLKQFGCNVEELKQFSFLSVDLPRQVNVDEVLNWLIELEEKEVIALACPAIRT